MLFCFVLLLKPFSKFSTKFCLSVNIQKMITTKVSTLALLSSFCFLWDGRARRRKNFCVSALELTGLTCVSSKPLQLLVFQMPEWVFGQFCTTGRRNFLRGAKKEFFCVSALELTGLTCVSSKSLQLLAFQMYA